MDRELMRRIELARMDARRRRHDSVLPEHLFGVVLETYAVSRALRERGLDATELRERLEVRLTSQPAIGGYRDGSDAPLSPILARVVERFGEPRAWLRFRRKKTILDELLREASIATLVFELRRGNDYRYLIERSRALAVMSAHRAVEVTHMFRVLLDLPSFVDAVHRADGNPVRLRDFVDEMLATTKPRTDPNATIAIGNSLQEVVATAISMARNSDATTPSIRQLCLALAQADEYGVFPPELEQFWKAAGIGASAFVHAVHLPELNSMRAFSLFR